MAMLKCKMCGGDLIVSEGVSTAACEYCGSLQTVPNLDDEKKLLQFERAEKLRKQCEFDKAAGIYETIVADFRDEAEAYWGLVLCKYGIEYVDDPATGKKVPTCHRSGFESVMDDSDLELALENANMAARKVYREEAKQIEEIRKGIIAVSANEQPYDIFICYKETDENGDRTLDSVLAQDLYDALTSKGYRVFFSRITLEDKLGVEYEPYIFAALNSARIMLAVGTDYEYFNAVWVKNEWSRFLKLMVKDKDKHLIPCYKGIDAYDMPKEFAKLQSQDLGKMGAIQDILRGVEKLIPKETSSVAAPIAATTAQPSTGSYLKRAFLFLEDQDWKNADDYCEKTLDIDPENAQAYLGKLMVDLKVKKPEQLASLPDAFDQNPFYGKLLRFADDELKATVAGYLKSITDRKELHRMEENYQKATQMMRTKTASGYQQAAKLFDGIRQYQDAASLAQTCHEKAEAAQKDELYDQGHSNMKRSTSSALEMAIKAFSQIPGWKDADEKLAQCQILFEQYKAKEENDRIAANKMAEEKRLAREKTVKRLAELRQKWSPVNALYSVGADHIAAVKTDGTVVATGSNARGQLNVYNPYYFSHIVAVSAGSSHTLGLKENGTVVATDFTGDRTFYDGQCNVNNWHDITAIAAAGARSLAITKKGTVLAVGSNACYHASKKCPCQVSDWNNVAKIRAGSCFTIGITKQGSVLAVGNDDNYSLASWRDIIDVCDCENYRMGLRSDGSVVVVHKSFRPEHCDVSNWKNIVQLAAGGNCIIGLKDDGTVVILGEPLNVDGWTDIVAIAGANRRAIGLKADGTVVATGSNTCNQLNVDGWTDIVSIGANAKHIFGIRADGTVVVSGDDDKYTYDVSKWKLFSSVDTIEEERQAKRAFAKQQQQWRSAGLCQHCGGALKGLFTKKCVSCGQLKNY